MTCPAVIQRGFFVAQVSKSAVSPTSSSANPRVDPQRLRIRKSATQQTWKSALRRAATNYVALLVIPVPKTTPWRFQTPRDDTVLSANRFVLVKSVTKEPGFRTNPKGDCALQPRVAATRLPWEKNQKLIQPQRGCASEVIGLVHRKDQRENARPRWEMIARLKGRNPDGVVGLVERSTQGSRVAATLGWRSKSRWDLPTRRQHAAPESQSPFTSRRFGSKTSLN